MVLTQEEIDACREAFLAFDKDKSGTIDVWELRQVLEEIGQAPTEDELFQVRLFSVIFDSLKTRLYM
jgi:calmodulin